MKNILRVLICNISLFVLLSACDLNIPGVNYTVDKTYIVKNSTNYKVQIRAYYKSKKYDEINLGTKQSLVKNIKDSSLRSIFSTEQFGYRDSILIIFDEKKAILQYCVNITDANACPQIEKRIHDLSRKEYKYGRSNVNYRKKSSRVTYCYEITNEDYDRAVPIEQLKK
jgi:hypothetical protein